MQRLTPQEFYTQKQYRELDKHGKRMDAFTYYDMLDFAEAYAAHVEASQWISVDERLPEIEKDETFHSANVLISYQFGVCEAFYDHENEMWFKIQGYKIKNVTHWRPLQTPLKQ